jgi:hypothetical protein
MEREIAAPRFPLQPHSPRVVTARRTGFPARRGIAAKACSSGSSAARNSSNMTI